MAKTMLFENVVVLEVDTQSTDKDGKQLKNKKGEDTSYTKLYCYEFGNKYKSLLTFGVSPDRVNAAKELLGKRCAITADCSMFQDKLSLYFASGSPVKTV